MTEIDSVLRQRAGVTCADPMCGPAGVYARIVAAHYAQAEKMDEARAGAHPIRLAIIAAECGVDLYRDLAPTHPEQERRWTKYIQAARAARDFADSERRADGAYINPAYLMPTERRAARHVPHGGRCFMPTTSATQPPTMTTNSQAEEI